MLDIKSILKKEQSGFYNGHQSSCRPRLTFLREKLSFFNALGNTRFWSWRWFDSKNSKSFKILTSSQIRWCYFWSDPIKINRWRRFLKTYVCMLYRLDRHMLTQRYVRVLIRKSLITFSKMDEIKFWKKCWNQEIKPFPMVLFLKRCDKNWSVEAFF